LKASKEIPAARSEIKNVRVLREIEKIQGYIRLKLAVENASPAVITDVRIELVFDRTILRLDRAEPDYRMKRNSVLIPSVGGGEKKTVAFYLDPKVCTDTAIDGIVSYSDRHGKLHTLSMKKKEISVALPISFTRKTANVAVLKNLVSEALYYHDTRIYSIPEGLQPERAFSMVKEIMSGRNVSYVRQYTARRPYRTEAWYYGETAAEGYRIVVKVAVEKEGVIAIFSAADNEEVLNHLLTELDHDLRERFASEGVSTVQVRDIVIRDSVINRASLLFENE